MGAGRLPPPEGALRRALFAASHLPGGGPVGAVLRRVVWLAFLALLVAQNPGARGRRAAALVAFGRAQLARARRRPYTVDLGRRGLMRCPPSSSIGVIVAAVGLHEFDEELFVDRFLRAGDVVIDAGSSIGFFAVPMALQGARVACFEPATETRAALEANVAANGVGDQVTVFPYGVADFDGPARVTQGLDSQNHLVLDGAAQTTTEAVEVRRIDSVVATEAPWLADATFVKVDVEGFDEQALSGAAELLRSAQPVLLVETRHGGRSVRGQLAAFGYVAFWYDASAHDLVPFPDDWAGNYDFHTNMLFVAATRLDEVRERLASATTALPSPPVVRA